MSPRGSQRLRPFLKWAGGKTQLLDRFVDFYPDPGAFDRYVEPFVGSAAVFFHLKRLAAPRAACLADSNEDLIHVYRQVRDATGPLIRALRRLRDRHDRETYYRVRAQDPRRLAPVARAARFLYLNKTCFNGLYRVNRRGEFNVPMGRYANPAILDEPLLRAASEALQGVDLRVAPYDRLPDWARRGDFVYIDPPYHPVSRTASFTAYTQGAFRAEDQERLADVCARLDRMGCLVMISNSDVRLIRDLYAARGFRMHRVAARRSINARADRRGAVGELVILNYDPPAAARLSAAASASSRRRTTRSRRSGTQEARPSRR